MRRRLLLILAIISVLLCVGVVVLGVRSRHTHDVVVWTRPATAWHFSSVGGKVWLFTHQSRVDWTNPSFGPPGQRWHEAVKAGAIKSLHIDRYPLLGDKERQAALDDLGAREREASPAAGFYRQVRKGIDAGNEKWNSILPWVEREYLKTMAAEERAWVRLQVADAPTKGEGRLGFQWFAGDGQNSRFFAVPYWALFLLTAALPALYLVLWRRGRRRSRTGLCPTCGYDLRATPERCPECGTEVPITAATSSSNAPSSCPLPQVRGRG